MPDEYLFCAELIVPTHTRKHSSDAMNSVLRTTVHNVNTVHSANALADLKLANVGRTIGAREMTSLAHRQTHLTHGE